tara:strand:+ start:443 stop:859 length:417 start_codon:yes stop_codon:yes gene_type:complete
MVGMFLKDREAQYTANRDEMTNTWRILDTWHEDLTNLGPEDEVEDTSKAVTILTEGAFIALVKEAARLGTLQNAAFENNSALEEENHILRERLLESEKSLHTTTQQVQKSEGYLLKEMAMQTMLKLTSMSDIENLTKD